MKLSTLLALLAALASLAAASLLPAGPGAWAARDLEDRVRRDRLQAGFAASDAEWHRRRLASSFVEKVPPPPVIERLPPIAPVAPIVDTPPPPTWAEKVQEGRNSE